MEAIPASDDEEKDDWHWGPLAVVQVCCRARRT